jgi:DNA-binding protein Fis
LIGKKTKRVALDLPTIEVRFENLNVEAKGYLGSRGLPSIFNYFLNMAEVCNIINAVLEKLEHVLLRMLMINLSCVLKGIAHFLHILPSQKKEFSVLSDVNGIIKPGR